MLPRRQISLCFSDKAEGTISAQRVTVDWGGDTWHPVGSNKCWQHQHWDRKAEHVQGWLLNAAARAEICLKVHHWNHLLFQRRFFQGRSDFPGKQMDAVSLLKQRVSKCQLVCEIRDLQAPFSIAKITMWCHVTLCNCTEMCPRQIFETIRGTMQLLYLFHQLVVQNRNTSLAITVAGDSSSWHRFY